MVNRCLLVSSILAGLLAATASARAEAGAAPAILAAIGEPAYVELAPDSLAAITGTAAVYTHADTRVALNGGRQKTITIHREKEIDTKKTTIRFELSHTVTIGIGSTGGTAESEATAVAEGDVLGVTRTATSTRMNSGRRVTVGSAHAIAFGVAR